MPHAPEPTQELTVHLPGEILRATCVAVLGDDRIVVELTSMPMAKSHTYKKNDRVTCQRTNAEIGTGSVWAPYVAPSKRNGAK